MTLSIEEINRLAAEACGREEVHQSEEVWGEERPFTTWCKHGDDEDCQIDYDPRDNPTESCWLPDYCTDRNTLPELFAMLAEKRDGSAYTMLWTLQRLIDPDIAQVGRSRDWLFLTASPLLVTVAALKALGKWPEGAEIPEVTP